ncbi:hypothetical protein KKF81_02010 [Candidatus Micrarchaeota archaeon]|nr:hypothetical protein [Candidatus Micrarchaeota archaeon]MBU1165695.1 hypothetical protein [Candidatus Micrarchaeota archaeon]MBU1887067.1 hypothetical protein [Candidatus Micrarchaeota archaeon]
MKQITIVADDKVGLLADLSYILAKAKINIETINADAVAGKSIITLGLSDTVRGKEVLQSSGYKVEDTNAVIIKLEDRPGELNKITATLSKEGVAISNVRMLSKDGKTTVLSMLVDKPKRAMNLMKEHLLYQEDAQ